MDTARNVIRAEGLSSLTMEKIAELTEYAKGTVYKHFSCKEDILCGLCLDGLGHLLKQFERASQYPGSSRERIISLGVAYKMFTLQYPEEFDLLISTRTNNIREKASPERMQQMDRLDTLIMDQIRNLIAQAIGQGDLSLTGSMRTDDICLGLWGMSFGLLILDQAKPLIKSLQASDTDQLMLSQIGCLMDGYGWHPLSADHDYNETYSKVLTFLTSAF